MPKILATVRDGSVHEVPAEPDKSVMEILREGGLDVAGSCGGNRICGTCHVYIEPSWMEKVGEPDADERELLEQFLHTQPTSRLSCQLRFHPTLDRLELTLAPEE